MNFQGNVKLKPGRHGRFQVLVDGKKMVGVTSVEILQTTREKISPDGWLMVEPIGMCEVVIRVLAHKVDFESAE